MNVLIACEESQEVCKAFRKLGHNAFSCDIVECSGGHPEWHIMGDCLSLLDGFCSFKTMTSDYYYIGNKWDLIIAHPPCTYLSNAATRAFSLKATPPEKVVARWENRAIATVFFMQMILCNCDKICVENPVGFMSKAYRRPDQYIEPYYFAPSIDSTEYVTKKTGLWLKGLKPLKRTNNLPKPKLEQYWSTYKNGYKSKTFVEYGAHGSKKRSKTFPGIAKAMAEQWGGI